MKRVIAALCLSMTAPVAVIRAQAATDTLRLSDLRAAALNADPRGREIELLAAQSSLRLRNIASEQRPAISIESYGQYQSDVPSIPVNLPEVNFPRPKHDTYDARVAVQQRLYDPSAAPRRAVERAQMEESQARVRIVLHSLAESVNGAFFTALRSQTQAAELETTITDLKAQLSVADARVTVGTALPGESSAIRAEILRRQQSLAEQNANRSAAIAILSDLVGRRIEPSAALSRPDLSEPVAAARNSLASLRNRPEYEQFSRARRVLELGDNIRSAQDRPRLSAFGRVGYGRPGLNLLSDRFDSYWLTGLQLQWTPWNWGATRRDREIGALQRQIVTSEEQAFTAALARGVEQDLASIDRLESALAQDDEIISLRESILSETRVRYTEEVVTSAEFVDRQTDVLAARLSRALHRVELSEARAHLLTTLGIEVR